MSWFNVLNLTGWLKGGTTETPVTEADPLPVALPSGIQAALDAINANTDQLEIKAENINLNTDALEAGVNGIRTDLGTDGATPPSIAGTGVRGWLRAIYEKLTGSVAVAGAHVISTANSTTTPLGSNATFTGPWENIEQYVSVQCLVNSDRLANQDSVIFEFSTDGINIDRSVAMTFQTGGDYAATPCKGKFFRLKVVNGSPAQSYLRVQTQFNAVAPAGKLVPFGDGVNLADAAFLVRGGIIGRSSQGGGTFVDVKADPSGSLLVVDGKTTGTWDYRSGTSGTLNIPAGGKVMQISAIAPTGSGATLTVNGGNTVTIPANQSFNFEPKGNLVAPTIVFTGTASYVVEYVS